MTNDTEKKRRAREKKHRQRARNPEKHRIYSRNWRKRNYARAEDQRLRKRYGITLAERAEMLETQGGKCLCCGTQRPGPQGWQVDHDHETGKVRGILCPTCNKGLGFLGDTLSKVRKRAGQMVKYLGGSVAQLPGIGLNPDWRDVAQQLLEQNQALTQENERLQKLAQWSTPVLAGPGDYIPVLEDPNVPAGRAIILSKVQGGPGSFKVYGSR